MSEHEIVFVFDTPEQIKWKIDYIVFYKQRRKGVHGYLSSNGVHQTLLDYKRP